MSKLSNSSYSAARVSSIIYSDMHGVDFSGDGSDISRHRFSYLENMYRDYDGNGSGAIESIPGFREVLRTGGKPNGIFSYRNESGEDMLVLHISSKIYRIALSDIDSQKSAEPICDAANNRSRAFDVGSSLFILDGEGIIRISGDFCGKISDTGGGIYVPTTYVNGKEHEQRNLLTRSFSEKTLLGLADTHAFGTATLKYSITDSELKTCRVTGILDPAATEIFVPSRIKIRDTYYSVTEIGAKAFSNAASARICRIAEGIKHIGNLAFWGCSSLESVILPNSVITLGNGVFSDCTSLTELHLGEGIESVGANVISMCGALDEISYLGNAVSFSKISGKEAFGDRSIAYDTARNEIDIGIEIFSPAAEISEVKVNGVPREFEVYRSGSLACALRLSASDRSEFDGATVVLTGTLSSSPEDYRGVHSGFLASRFAADTDIASVIGKCTVAESYDGRIFLSGNPSYPGACFFSASDSTGENNPLYFGDMNYFCDGVGSFGVKTMLATSDGLAVFKSGDDGGGSIYYHTARETGIDLIPKIYPVAYIHSGVVALSRARSFFDDPVFITDCGVCALDKKQINLERSIAVRSHNVNPKLLLEDLNEAEIDVWRGYLIVSACGRMYLADSRDTFRHSTGSLEYEWYFLNGIGSWQGGERVYRYSPSASEGLSTHESTDEAARGVIYSRGSGDEQVYYTVEDGVYYEVYPTNEYTGGTFSPAKLILAVGERLLFLTEDGTLCLFNNDKRGTLPREIEELYSGEDERSAYLAALGRRIHPYYYSFGNRAARYALITAKDNCDIPHLEKSTVKGSLTLKCLALSSAILRCEVGTDKDGYSEVCRFPGASFSFGDMSFDSLSFSTSDTYTVPIAEKTKGWVEKQISIYSESFRSPFGLYNVAYRFTVKGSIKKNR